MDAGEWGRKIPQKATQRDKEMECKKGRVRNAHCKFSRSLTHLLRVPEGKNRKRGAEVTFKEMREKNFLKLKSSNWVYLEGQNRIHWKPKWNKPTPVDIGVKYQNIREKEKLLESSGEEAVHPSRKVKQSDITLPHQHPEQEYTGVVAFWKAEEKWPCSRILYTTKLSNSLSSVRAKTKIFLDM